VLQVWRRRVVIDEPNERSEAYTGNHVGRKGDPHLPEVWYSPEKRFKMQAAIAYAYEKPTQRNRFGEIPEACRGHQDMACMERSVEELGRSHGFLRSRTEIARQTDNVPRRGNPETEVGRSLNEDGPKDDR